MIGAGAETLSFGLVLGSKPHTRLRFVLVFGGTYADEQWGEMNSAGSRRRLPFGKLDFQALDRPLLKRDEILARLVDLNRQRAEEKRRSGRPDQNTSPKRKRVNSENSK